MAEPLKVLFLAAEALPFVKTGGLADVAGALPPALRQLGVDVRLMLPLYRALRPLIPEGAQPVLRVSVPLGGHGALQANVWEVQGQRGVPVYLLEREDLYDRPGLYGGPDGDYYDNLARFSFWCHAALRAAPKLGFVPDLVHANDWHAGLAAALLAPEPLTGYRDGPSALAGCRCVFTIHNLGYQGRFSPLGLPSTGLPGHRVFHMDGLEFWGDLSLLKAGVAYADTLTTVSERYAAEICTPEYGEGLDGLLRHRRDRLQGVLNGIDTTAWDPGADLHLPAAFGPDDLAGKQVCRAAVLQRLGMSLERAHRPVVGLVTRLTEQKGVDLLLDGMEEVLGLDVSLAVLGSGAPDYEERLRALSRAHPDRVGVHLGYDEPFAHQLIAGADALLVPSRYEPCGLTQLYALRYGTLPVVRATGGLADSVADLDPSGERGTGFVFEQATSEALVGALGRLTQLWRDPPAWIAAQRRAMAQDFSWDRSAATYLRLYEETLRRPRATPAEAVSPTRVGSPGS